MKLENARQYILNVHGGTNDDGKPAVAKIKPGEVVDVDPERGAIMLESRDWKKPGTKSKPRQRTGGAKRVTDQVTDADTGEPLDVGGDAEGN